MSGDRSRAEQLRAKLASPTRHVLGVFVSDVQLSACDGRERERRLTRRVFLHRFGGAVLALSLTLFGPVNHNYAISAGTRPSHGRSLDDRLQRFSSLPHSMKRPDARYDLGTPLSLVATPLAGRTVPRASSPAVFALRSAQDVRVLLRRPRRSLYRPLPRLDTARPTLRVPRVSSESPPSRS